MTNENKRNSPEGEAWFSNTVFLWKKLRDLIVGESLEQKITREREFVETVTSYEFRSKIGEQMVPIVEGKFFLLEVIPRGLSEEIIEKLFVTYEIKQIMYLYTLACSSLYYQFGKGNLSAKKGLQYLNKLSCLFDQLRLKSLKEGEKKFFEDVFFVDLAKARNDQGFEIEKIPPELLEILNHPSVFREYFLTLFRERNSN